MKRKILAIATIGSVFCMILTGCGVKESVTVSADAIITNDSGNTIVNGSSLKGLNEEIVASAKEKKAELEEYIQDKEIEEEIERLLQVPIPLTDEERQKMIAEKLDANDYDDIMDEVPVEITEKYNRRLEEKEQGVFYVPEEIYSKYMNISDAEIIELVNERQFELHNELRAELGLPLFERDERLDEVADIRAEEASYFFTHTRPNGESVLEILSTLDMPSYGENINVIANYEPNALFKEDYKWLGDAGFNALCNSPGHYANITEKHYTKIGIDSYVIHYEDGVIVIYTAFEFGS